MNKEINKYSNKQTNKQMLLCGKTLWKLKKKVTWLTPVLHSGQGHLFCYGGCT